MLIYAYSEKNIYCTVLTVILMLNLFLFLQIEVDISKKYHKRPVNIMGVNI